MAPSRFRRRRGQVAACLLTLAVAGCASDDPSTPRPDPTVTEPSGTTAATDSDGVTTTSDVYPTWSAIDGLETPRDDFGTAVVGSDIWVLGGMTGERGNRLLNIEVFDTASQTWTTSEVEMPVGVASFEVVAVGPRIYAFGGFDAASQAMDFAAVLDTGTGRWRDLPPLPHARYAHTVTTFDGVDLRHRWPRRGGRDRLGRRFDPRTETWTTLDRPMPKARVRDSHKTVAAPQGLVVAGGQRDFQDSDLVDLFDPRTGRWTTLPDLPEPMSRAGDRLRRRQALDLAPRVGLRHGRDEAEDLGARQRADPLAARHGVRRPRRLSVLDRRLCAEPVARRAHRRPDEAPLRGRAAMRIDVVTIFPEYLAPLRPVAHRQGARDGLLDVHVHDLRDFTHDRHRTVDDTPVRRRRRAWS